MQYKSTTLLADLYTQTESHIEKAIKVWQMMPAQILNYQPAPGKWSAVQCLEHLNSYGRYYLPAIDKAIKAACAGPSENFKSGWLGNYFYKLMLTDNSGKVIKKMKSPRNHQPGISSDPVTVLSEFISQLETLGILLTLAQQVNLNKLKVPISIGPFIKLKLGDTFLFYTTHISRHIIQADRAIQSANDHADGSITHNNTIPLQEV